MEHTELLNAIVANPTGTYIFAGSDRAGMYQAAKDLARLLHCKNQESCIECAQIASENHPDLIIVRPEETKSIGISQTKEMVRLLSLQKYSTKGHRIVIIEPAELLTIEAQNSLLKTLEELPEHTQVVLIAKRADQLLPTIQSRSKVVSFGASELHSGDFDEIFDGIVDQSDFDRLVLAEELSKQDLDVEIFIRELSIRLAMYVRELASGKVSQEELAGILQAQQALLLFHQQQKANVPLKTALSGLLLAL